MLQKSDSSFHLKKIVGAASACLRFNLEYDDDDDDDDDEDDDDDDEDDDDDDDDDDDGTDEDAYIFCFKKNKVLLLFLV